MNIDNKTPGLGEENQKPTPPIESGVSSQTDPGKVITPEPIKDGATENGSYIISEMAVGGYLEKVGLYDPNKRRVDWNGAIIISEFQRAALPLPKNPIKRRMLRDLMRGGTLPPIVLYQRDGQRPLVVDGLQRTHVLAEGLKGLLAKEHDEAPEGFVQEELDAMQQLGQKSLSVDDYLARPIVLQEWRDLSSDELVRLFMILNVGQQKVSPRHLLEVMGDDLKEMFEEWGLPLITERQEKERPRRRGRPRREDLLNAPVAELIPDVIPFRYEYLLDALMAYVTRDPQIKTNQIILDRDTPNLALEQRVTEIGSEFCRSDFVWACTDLNRAIQHRYEADPKWRVVIQSSDNFFLPLMAALGDARHNEKVRTSLEERKKKLIELIATSAEKDPLNFSGDEPESLSTVISGIRSNIGRRQRAVVYNACRRYFWNGLLDSDYPLEWRTALLSE